MLDGADEVARSEVATRKAAAALARRADKRGMSISSRTYVCVTRAQRERLRQEQGIT